MDIAFLIKVGVVAALLLIVASLAVALVRLVQDRGRSTRTAKALTVRIGLSILLFLALLAAVFLGVIEPHGVAP